MFGIDGDGDVGGVFDWLLFFWFFTLDDRKILGSPKNLTIVNNLIYGDEKLIYNSIAYTHSSDDFIHQIDRSMRGIIT